MMKNQPKALIINKVTFFLFLYSLSTPILIAQPNPLSFEPQLLLVDNNEACDVGDIDKDGMIDVVAGRLWFKAPDFVPRPLRPIALHPPDYARNNGEHLLDVNQDGWLDVIATGWGDGRIFWYKNPGKTDLEKGLEWKASILADTKNKHGEIGLIHDLDQDGQPEFIMNSYQKNTPLTVWRQADYLADDPILLGTIIGQKNSHGVGFGDVNGDGRTDLLFDDGWYEQPPSHIWEGHWKYHADWQFDKAGCPIQVIDLNGDGRNDIIWGKGHQYGLFWEEQKAPKGDSTIWERHLIDRSWSQTHAMTLADLDDDGQPELLTGKRIWAHSGKDPGAAEAAHLYLYQWNQQTQSFDRQQLSSGKIGTGLLIRVIDLNEDGKKDIVVAGKTGTYILWQN